MKLKVCAEFVDKYTGDVYPAGAEIEVTDERGAEILQAPGLAEEIEQKSKPAPAPKRKRGAAK